MFHFSYSLFWHPFNLGHVSNNFFFLSSSFGLFEKINQKKQRCTNKRLKKKNTSKKLLFIRVLLLKFKEFEILFEFFSVMLYAVFYLSKPLCAKQTAWMPFSLHAIVCRSLTVCMEYNLEWEANQIWAFSVVVVFVRRHECMWIAFEDAIIISENSKPIHNSLALSFICPFHQVHRKCFYNSHFDFAT